MGKGRSLRSNCKQATTEPMSRRASWGHRAGRQPSSTHAKTPTWAAPVKAESTLSDAVPLTGHFPQGISQAERRVTPSCGFPLLFFGAGWPALSAHQAEEAVPRSWDLIR